MFVRCNKLHDYTVVNVLRCVVKLKHMCLEETTIFSSLSLSFEWIFLACFYKCVFMRKDLMNILYFLHHFANGDLVIWNAKKIAWFQTYCKDECCCHKQISFIKECTWQLKRCCVSSTPDTGKNVLGVQSV